jgi:hypothetical protein
VLPDGIVTLLDRRPNSGALSFLNSPDFETREDFNHDNAYDPVVIALWLTPARHGRGTACMSSAVPLIA